MKKQIEAMHDRATALLRGTDAKLSRAFGGRSDGLAPLRKRVRKPKGPAQAA